MEMRLTQNCKYCGWIHSDWLSCDKAKALGEIRKVEPAKVTPEPIQQQTPLPEQKSLTQSEKMKIYWQKKKEKSLPN